MKIYQYATALLALNLTTYATQAQTLLAAEPAAPTAAPVSKPTWLPNTLLKLSTGLSRESGYGGYTGLLLPVTVGAEYQISRAFSAYATVSPTLRPFKREQFSGYRQPFVHNAIIDLGGRYYYNQAKREQRGRAYGPFVGNYLALQANADITHFYYYYEASTRYQYASNGVAVLWGMQRHIGQWGLFDLNVGPRLYKDTRYGFYSRYQRLNVDVELNVRIGLAH